MARATSLLAAALGLYAAAHVHAEVTSIDVVQVDGQSILPDHVVNDVLVDFTGGLRGQQMIVELTQGSIFVCPDPNGLRPAWVPPPIVFPPVDPAHLFCTFVGYGGPSDQAGLVVGSAVDIDPDAEMQFDSDGLNIAWAPGTGVSPPTANDFFTARITLSNDARGTFRYLGWADPGEPLFVQYPIFQGVISVPEPATAGLVLIALAGSIVLAGRRCRSAAGVA